MGLCTAAAVLIADQVSKYYILNAVLEDRAMIIYTSWFNLVKAWNTGVSFSMFNDKGFWGVVMLSALAAGIIAFLLIDRIRLGAVFDFLDFHIGEAHWPAFNVSDSFICIGAIIIIIHSLFNKDKSAI